MTQFTQAQTKQVKQLMANRKRELSTVRRSFPKDKAALKSTHAYVHAYYRENGLTMSTNVDALFPNLNKAPTTWPSGEEVIVETVDDDISDLI